MRWKVEEVGFWELIHGIGLWPKVVVDQGTHLEEKSVDYYYPM